MARTLVAAGATALAAKGLYDYVIVPFVLSSEGQELADREEYRYPPGRNYVPPATEGGEEGSSDEETDQQYGREGDFPSNEAELARLFEAASEVVRADRRAGSLPSNVRLSLYASFKQARNGDCTVAQPSLADQVGRYKWQAWVDLRGMGSSEAMRRYLTLLDESIPGWRQQLAAGAGGAAASPPQAAGSNSSGSGGGGGSMGPVMSRPALDFGAAGASAVGSELAEGDAASDYLELWGAIQDGDVDKLRTILQTGRCSDLSTASEDGEAALHLAADAGNVELIRLLLEAGADANVLQAEVNQTPLFYAILAEKADAAQFLLRNGARLDVRDVDGQAPLDYCEEASVRARLQAAADE